MPVCDKGLHTLKNAEGMLNLIREFGLIPFFANQVPGSSIEEHTAPDQWFTEENLGPWDWKIDCVQSGDVAYGKFLFGGKAAFATVDVYRELANWRRSLPKYSPAGAQAEVLEFMEERGSVSCGDVRKLLGIKKSAADALLAKLQMQSYLITKDFKPRINKHGENYGWPVAVMTPPEYLWGYKFVTGQYKEMPGESYRRMVGQISKFYDVTDKNIRKIL